MRDVGRVMGRVSLAKVDGFCAAGQPDGAKLHGQQFASARKVRLAAKRCPGPKDQLVIFHRLFQMQWRKRADPAMSIGTIVISTIIGPNHLDPLHRLRRFDQLAQGQIKRPSNPASHRQRRIGIAALNLTEH